MTSTLDIANIRVIFFDLDNTLLDHSSAERSAFFSTCKQYQLLGEGRDPIQLFASYQQINLIFWNHLRNGEMTAGQVRVQRWVEFLLENYDFGRAYSLQLAEDMSVYYLESYEQFWQLTSGAQELVTTARRYSQHIGIITNSFPEQAKRKLKRFRWEYLFDALIISDEVGAAKPSTEIFRKALEVIELDTPTQALYIGDHYEVDMIGANDAGWQTMWFNPHYLELPDTSAANAIVYSLHEARELILSGKGSLLHTL